MPRWRRILRVGILWVLRRKREGKNERRSRPVLFTRLEWLVQCELGDVGNVPPGRVGRGRIKKGEAPERLSRSAYPRCQVYVNHVAVHFQTYLSSSRESSSDQLQPLRDSLWLRFVDTDVACYEVSLPSLNVRPPSWHFPSKPLDFSANLKVFVVAGPKARGEKSFSSFLDPDVKLCTYSWCLLPSPTVSRCCLQVRLIGNFSHVTAFLMFQYSDEVFSRVPAPFVSALQQ